MFKSDKKRFGSSPLYVRRSVLFLDNLEGRTALGDEIRWKIIVNYNIANFKQF